MDRPLIVLDTETATLRGAPHLLELGAVRVIDGEVADTFDSLVCPSVPIDPQATEIHGIVEDDVRTAPTTREVLAGFQDWAGSDWFVAHNAPFDAGVLGFEYARHGLAPPEGPFIDTLPLARKAFPEAHDHKLITLCQLLELEEGVHHRALSDAVWCWKVLEGIVERLGGPDSVHSTQLLAGGAAPLSIKSSAPAPPRLSPRLRPLPKAVLEGSAVKLLYSSGSGVPITLNLSPMFLFRRSRKDYMEAECHQSGLLKTYLLERVVRVL